MIVMKTHIDEMKKILKWINPLGLSVVLNQELTASHWRVSTLHVDSLALLITARVAHSTYKTEVWLNTSLHFKKKKSANLFCGSTYFCIKYLLSQLNFKYQITRRRIFRMLNKKQIRLFDKNYFFTDFRQCAIFRWESKLLSSLRCFSLFTLLALDYSFFLFVKLFVGQHVSVVHR